MSWPITKVDTSICYIDNVRTTFVIFDNFFEITWSRPDVNKLLHILVASVDSVLKNGSHSIHWHEGIFLRIHDLIG